jgi:hypothetical protein
MMALSIIDKDCRIEDGKLVIVVQGDNPEEVLSNTAKSMALQKAAACGYPRIGINGQSGSFPVDADGKTYDDWNDQARRGLIVGYRNEIKLMGGL